MVPVRTSTSNRILLKYNCLDIVVLDLSQYVDYFWPPLCFLCSDCDQFMCALSDHAGVDVEIEPLTLANIRESLIQQEDTIIYALLQRAQFGFNSPTYDNSSFSTPGFNGSLLQFMLKETEHLHAKVSTKFPYLCCYICLCGISGGLMSGSLREGPSLCCSSRLHLFLSSSIVSKTFKKQLGMVSHVMASHNMPSSFMKHRKK